ncbi:MAG: hypothetical protein IPP88_17765 [Betaproteobacteria bacterium]|nr:hypothetical protein [Betaproteobacteria bacterium]
MQRRSGEGLAFAQRAMAINEKNRLPQYLEAAVNAALANAWLDQNDYVRAEKLLIHAGALYDQAQVQPSVRTADYIVALARVHLRTGRAVRPNNCCYRSWLFGRSGQYQWWWHGESLYWLSRAEAKLGETQGAQTHRVDAVRMLQKSTLPALRWLALS